MHYRSRRDHRFDHSTDAIRHIEKHNCAKGCRVPDPEDIPVFGPGGNCPILAAVAVGNGEPIEELEDDDQIIQVRVMTRADDPWITPRQPGHYHRPTLGIWHAWDWWHTAHYAALTAVAAAASVALAGVRLWRGLKPEDRTGD